MDKVFYDLHFYRCYIDNIIIFNNTPKEHVRHLRPVLKWLRQWGLRLHHGKCKIFHDGLVYLGHKLIPGGFGCNKLRCTLCRRSRYWSMCQDFMLSWAWQITTVNSSRTLAWSLSLSPFPRAMTNLGLEIMSIASRHWSKDWVRLYCFDVRMSQNPCSCIRPRVHWVWKQFSLRMMTLAGIMLLLMLCKATTLRRPIIHPIREKRLWWYGLLPISNHISMVSSLFWWLIINTRDREPMTITLQTL